MGSVGNPNPWGAYGNYKDCSQGICSIYCPQWCYIIFPPPPPSDNSGTDFSPLIIAVIGILASTFLLVCYYTIISKYCRRRSRDQNSTSAELDENRDEMNHETWQVAPAGLDDAVIKSITVSKYKKGDGLVEGTDCSVCLNEFEEDESLRLLPKCNHAFHLPCIDTWLKSHSSCPLCRSNINVNSNAPTNIPLPPPIPEARSNNINISALEYVQHRYDSVLVVHDLENGIDQPEAIVSLNVSEVIIAKTPTHALGDHKEDSDEIRSQGLQQFRRSVSLDSSSRQGCVSIADILRISEDDDGFQVDNHQFSSQEYGKSNNTLHLHCNAAAMERSLSMGRFVFSRHGKGRNSIIPN